MWTSREHRQISDLYHALALAILAFLALRHTAATVDLETWDEAYFVWATKTGVLDFSWSPLYLWLCRLCALFFPDPIDLFYALDVLQPILLATTHYLAARRLGVRASFSFLGALLVLLSCAYPSYATKTTLFNATLWYFAFYASTFLRQEIHRWMALAFVGLILIYLRQDNLIPGLGCLGIAVWKILQSHETKEKRLRDALRWGGGFFLALAFCLRVASPFTADRTWNTFSAQFYWGNTHRHGLPPSHNHWEYAQAKFGKTKSIFRAFFLQPAAVTEHMLYNVSKIPGEFYASFAARTPLTRRTAKRSWLNSITELSAILGGLAIAGWLLRQRKKTNLAPHRAHDELERMWWWLFAFCLVRGLGTATLLSVVPRYLAEVIFFSYFSLFLLLDRWVPRQMENAMFAVPLCLVGAFATADFRQDAPDQPIKSRAEFLRQIPQLGQKTLYNDGGMYFYSPTEPRHLSTWHYQNARDRGARSFGNFLARSGVDLAIIDVNTYVWLANLEKRYGVSLTPRKLESTFSQLGYHRVRQFSDGAVIYATAQLAAEIAPKARVPYP